MRVPLDHGGFDPSTLVYWRGLTASERPHPRDAILHTARRDWVASLALHADYPKHRPDIERVISQIASRGGRRIRLRYRGTARSNAWLQSRAAAPNLRNLTARGLA